MTVELENLISGDEVEDWFPLGGLTPPIREDWGSLRVRIRYVHEVIMPLAEYNALKEVNSAVYFQDLKSVSYSKTAQCDRLQWRNANFNPFTSNK